MVYLWGGLALFQLVQHTDFICIYFVSQQVSWTNSDTCVCVHTCFFVPFISHSFHFTHWFINIINAYRPYVADFSNWFLYNFFFSSSSSAFLLFWYLLSTGSTSKNKKIKIQPNVSKTNEFYVSVWVCVCIKIWVYIFFLFIIMELMLEIEWRINDRSTTW